MTGLPNPTFSATRTEAACAGSKIAQAIGNSLANTASAQAITAVTASVALQSVTAASTGSDGLSIAGDLSGALSVAKTSLESSGGHGVALTTVTGGKVSLRGGSVTGSAAAVQVTGTADGASSVGISGVAVSGGTGHGWHAAGTFDAALTIAGGTVTSTAGDAVHFDSNAPKTSALFARYFKL